MALNWQDFMRPRASNNGEQRNGDSVGGEILAKKATLKNYEWSSSGFGRRISVLEMESAQLSDSGRYECIARNSLGEA